MNNSLSLLFSYSFENPIWKVLSDATSEKLIVQLKATDSFTASYFMVSPGEKTEPYKIALSKAEQKETLVGFVFPYIVLQIHTDDQNPGISEYVLWDMVNKKAIATNGAAFLSTSAKGLYFGWKSELRFWHKKEKRWEVVSELPLAEETKTIFPAFFEQDEPEFIKMADFLMKKLNHQPVLGIEYLEYTESIFISYYILNAQQKFDNYLLCVNNLGKVLLHECINFGAKGIGQDTFFIFADKLIFLNGHQKLTIYQTAVSLIK